MGTLKKEYERVPQPRTERGGHQQFEHWEEEKGKWKKGKYGQVSYEKDAPESKIHGKVPEVDGGPIEEWEGAADSSGAGVTEPAAPVVTEVARRWNNISHVYRFAESHQ